MVGVLANQIVTVTPSDTVDNPAGPFVPMVQTSGTYKVTLVNDVDTLGTTIYMLAGILYPILVKRVWLTGISGTVNGFISTNV